MGCDRLSPDLSTQPKFLLFLLFFVCLFCLLKTQYVSEDDFELLNLVHLPSAGTIVVHYHTQLPGPSSKHRLCCDWPVPPPLWVLLCGKSKKSAECIVCSKPPNTLGGCCLVLCLGWAGMAGSSILGKPALASGHWT